MKARRYLMRLVFGFTAACTAIAGDQTSLLAIKGVVVHHLPFVMIAAT
jgi:hypothetical protein